MEKRNSQQHHPDIPRIPLAARLALVAMAACQVTEEPASAIKQMVDDWASRCGSIVEEGVVHDKYPEEWRATKINEAGLEERCGCLRSDGQSIACYLTGHTESWENEYTRFSFDTEEHRSPAADIEIGSFHQFAGDDDYLNMNVCLASRDPECTIRTEAVHNPFFGRPSATIRKEPMEADKCIDLMRWVDFRIFSVFSQKKIQ